jgi:hypothetical protein
MSDTSTKLPLWTVHIEPLDGSNHGVRERRVRAESREAAEQSANVDRTVWHVWASWKCDCGC